MVTPDTQVGAEVEADAEPVTSTTFSVPWSKLTTRRRRELYTPDDTTHTQRAIRSEARSRLLNAIAQGRIWLDQLVHNRKSDGTSLATQQRLSEKSIRATLSLALFVPDIIYAAIEGRLRMGLSYLKRACVARLFNKKSSSYGTSNIKIRCVWA